MRGPATTCVIAALTTPLIGGVHDDRAHHTLLSAQSTLAQSRGQATPVDVYILTGQSNSLGTTNLEGWDPSEYGPGEDPADASISFYWANVHSNNWSYPPNLYGDSGGHVLQLQMQQADGTVNPAFWGPEFGLARSLYQADSGRDIVVIKVSRGGGGNTLWSKAAFEADPNAGHMWGHLRDTVGLALGALSAEGTTFCVKGLVYLQGESNTNAEADIAGDRLIELADDLKIRINAQYPGTADGLHVVAAEIASSTGVWSRLLTTWRQMDLAAILPNVFFVRTADLPLKADGIHFGRDAKLAIGNRVAQVLLGGGNAFDIGRQTAAAGNPTLPEDIVSPAAQGFAEVGAGEGVTLVGVIDGDTPAWRVFDDASNLNPGYQRALNVLDFKGMFERGWSLSATVRVVSGGGLALWSVTADDDPGWGIADGAGNMNGFLLDRVDGNALQIRLWGGPAGGIQTLEPGSADVFHQLALRGQPGSALCDFFIDGELALADIDMTANGGIYGYQDMLLFNSGSSGGVGREVLWHEVSLKSNPLALPEPACSGDVDASGGVDVADLLLLLDGWGACSSECFCLGDVDDDGLIGIDDMLGVLAQWGVACGP